MRVAVTTSPDAAERWTRLLRDAGFDPVELPCIQVRLADQPALDRLRVEAESADLLLLTSPRAVRALWPDGGMPPVRCAVVGSATGDAVTAAGGDVALVGSAGGDQLVDELEGQVEGTRIVFAHAGATDPVRAERLRSAGAEVVRGVAYETVPIPPAYDAVEAALFGSPSAVEGWRIARDLEDVAVVGAMGPTTAAALSRVGREPDIVPESPSVRALVNELVAHQEVR